MAGSDVVVVGGGFAGASLATVLARAGKDVLLLERQAVYRDLVRGELLWPWGVAEACRLGVDSVLLAAGANRATSFESHDEGRSEPYREPVAGLDGAIGSLNLAHATACHALAEAARDAGAAVLGDVRAVAVTAGAHPAVEYLHGGRRHEARTRLVVGADGRTSSVRKDAGIALELDEPAHLVTGLLAEGLDDVDESVDLIARERDLLFLAFPQRDGRARLYHCFPAGQRDRFAGPAGAERFLAACALSCLPDAERWAAARVAGPCATFPARDTRAATPVAPGVVLIGDAAGYENPLLGQGLSMALRDVRDVADALTTEGAWDESVFGAYVEGRRRRHRVAKLATLMEVWVNDGYDLQDPAIRVDRRERVFADELLTAVDATTWRGFDSIDAEAAEPGIANLLAA
jgi:menaquinone-9 beta-reductase